MTPEEQNTLLKGKLVEERARALWFAGDDPNSPENLDWTAPPNDISESVRKQWEVPAREQLRAEMPEVFK